MRSPHTAKGGEERETIETIKDIALTTHHATGLERRESQRQSSVCRLTTPPDTGESEREFNQRQSSVCSHHTPSLQWRVRERHRDESSGMRSPHTRLQVERRDDFYRGTITVR